MARDDAVVDLDDFHWVARMAAFGESTVSSRRQVVSSLLYLKGE